MLRHVLWIGGAPGAGKTTVARRLARRHGLRWYNADAHTWEHRDRALAAGDPAALRWEAMTPHERWVETTPAEMVELSLTFARGEMIVDDLRHLPASPLIVAEGSTVLPEVVERGVARRGARRVARRDAGAPAGAARRRAERRRALAARRRGARAARARERRDGAARRRLARA